MTNIEIIKETLSAIEHDNTLIEKSRSNCYGRGLR